MLSSRHIRNVQRLLRQTPEELAGVQQFALRSDEVNQPVAALPPVGPLVRQILDGGSRVIGVANHCLFRWDRPGATTFDLIGGQSDQWTVERIYGRLGRFSAECRNLAVAVNNPYLQYELYGANNADLRLLAGVELPGFASRLAPANQAVSGSAQPVGAMGLTTVFGLLSLVWALLHSRATLNLPGTVEFTAFFVDPGTLVIEFKKPPTVTVVCGIQFTCQPNSLTLTERSAVMKYRAGIFTRQEEWKW